MLGVLRNLSKRFSVLENSDIINHARLLFPCIKSQGQFPKRLQAVLGEGKRILTVKGYRTNK